MSGYERWKILTQIDRSEGGIVTGTQVLALLAEDLVGWDQGQMSLTLTEKGRQTVFDFVNGHAR